jgi:hypothetical protein
LSAAEFDSHRFGFAAGCEAVALPRRLLGIIYLGLSPRFGLWPNLRAEGQRPEPGAEPRFNSS